MSTFSAVKCGRSNFSGDTTVRHTHTTQLGSLVVGYELVVGCDNPTWDRGADLRRPETTPGASAGGLVRATCLGKAIGARGYLCMYQVVWLSGVEAGDSLP